MKTLGEIFSGRLRKTSEETTSKLTLDKLKKKEKKQTVLAKYKHLRNYT